MNNKKKFWIMVLSTWGFLLIFATVMLIVDPYFHYHAPLSGIKYRMNEERYINNGIAKNFVYDAVITGTSTCENFKTSEMDVLFDCNSVKLPFSGALYKEISDNLLVALESDNQVKYVVWGIDGFSLITQWDEESYGGYPDYLYDDNVWNDVYYLLNKESMYRGTIYDIMMTVKGEKSTSFDEYASWDHETGLQAILQYYSRSEETLPDRGLLEMERELVTDNVQKNICSVVEKYPDTTFYFFYSPVSITRWDLWNNEGTLTAQIEAEEIATKMLLPYPNVKLFCFFENTDLITDVNYYKDTIHYESGVNSMILQWMQEGKYQLTMENAEAHTNHEKEFYQNYDYDSIYESIGGIR